MLSGDGDRLPGAQRYPDCQDPWASHALTLYEGVIGDRLDRAHGHARRVASRAKGLSRVAVRAAGQLATSPTAPVEYGLRLALFQRRQNAKPGARGAKPELVVGDHLIALADAANAQAHDIFVFADRR